MLWCLAALLNDRFSAARTLGRLRGVPFGAAASVVGRSKRLLRGDAGLLYGAEGSSGRARRTGGAGSLGRELLAALALDQDLLAAALCILPQLAGRSIPDATFTRNGDSNKIARQRIKRINEPDAS